MDKNRKKLFINIGITVAVIIIAAILGAIAGEIEIQAGFRIGGKWRTIRLF